MEKSNNPTSEVTLNPISILLLIFRRRRCLWRFPFSQKFYYEYSILLFDSNLTWKNPPSSIRFITDTMLPSHLHAPFSLFRILRRCWRGRRTKQSPRLSRRNRNRWCAVSRCRFPEDSKPVSDFWFRRTLICRAPPNIPCWSSCE